MSEEDNEDEESLDVDDEGLEGDEESEERNLTVRLRRQERTWWLDNQLKKKMKLNTDTLSESWLKNVTKEIYN